MSSCGGSRGLRPQAGTQSLKGSTLGAGFDVVVEPEQVRRVVLRLDRHEPIVVTAEADGDPSALVFGNVVYVDGASGERLRGCPKIPRPLHTDDPRARIG